MRRDIGSWNRVPAVVHARAWALADRSAALKREYAIKQLTRTEKLALVRSSQALQALRSP